MSVIHAIYENGVFRPLGPVDLPEHARVVVALEEPDKDAVDADASCGSAGACWMLCRRMKTPPASL